MALTILAALCQLSVGFFTLRNKNEKISRVFSLKFEFLVRREEIYEKLLLWTSVEKQKCETGL